MKTYVKFENLYGSNMEIMFRMKGFHPNEHFRVLVDGSLQYTRNEDTPHFDKDVLQEIGEDADETFITMSTGVIPYGENSIEISVLSEFEVWDPDFVSTAQVEIKRISFNGTLNGGARECIPVPDGWYAPELSIHP